MDGLGGILDEAQCASENHMPFARRRRSNQRMPEEAERVATVVWRMMNPRLRKRLIRCALDEHPDVPFAQGSKT
jgi:hypothetical protein